MYKAKFMTLQHFIFYILGTYLMSTLLYPSFLIKENTDNGWIISIISSIVFICAFIYISNILFKANNISFKSFIYDTMGVLLGRIYLTFFISMLIMTLSGLCAVYANSISTSIFIKTPTWFILIIFISCCYLITTMKNSNSNIFTIIICTMIFVTVILLFILLQKYRKLSNINTINLSTLFNGKFLSNFCLQLGTLSSFGIILPLFSKVKIKDKPYKKILPCLFVIAVIFLLSIIGGISIFGVKRFSNIYYPLFIQSQLIYHEGIIENGDALVLLIITLSAMLKYTITVSSLNILLPDSISTNKGLIGLCSVFIFFISSYLSSNINVLFQYIKVYQYWSLIIFLIFPIIFCTIFNFFKN